MRFTAEHIIPVKDRRRKRRFPRVGAVVGAIAVMLAEARHADVIGVFPVSWHPYIVGGGIVAMAFGVYERLSQHRDGQRYLSQVSQNAVRRLQQDGDQ